MNYNYSKLGDDIMLHEEVLKAYKSIFDLGEIDVWFANGYNSVRIRFINNEELVFSYTNMLDWKLETLDNHIMTMGKPNKQTKKDMKKRWKKL